MSEILDKAIISVQNSQNAFCRFITANDTGKTGAHQAGFYIPKCAASLLFARPPHIYDRGANKDKMVRIKWQDEFFTDSRIIYYGSGTRNEYRVTRFGRFFPFLEERCVGDLLVLSKKEDSEYDAYVLSADSDIDDFLAQFNLSSEDTNKLIDLGSNKTSQENEDQFIESILRRFVEFPTTKEMAMYARQIYSLRHSTTDADLRSEPDKHLLGWNKTEYELFRKFENKVYAPIISAPFADCQTLIDFSNSILNRRKSRAGKSLENHLATIFTAAQLRFEEQVITEDRKKPDFIFPGSEEYHDFTFPADSLVFLGAKTTCKDRWRQVINEADRIDIKYLFTLQQGISTNQLREMRDEGVRLVVPAPYRKSFDRSFWPEIETLSSFIDIVSAKQR